MKSMNNRFKIGILHKKLREHDMQRGLVKILSIGAIIVEFRNKLEMLVGKYDVLVFQ